MSHSKTMSISCQDGYTLSAQFYPAQYTLQEFPILICPATGITKQFYHHFATWLSEQGYATLVFDFRGIGGSLYEDIKYSTTGIVQWGQLDIPAAIDALLTCTQRDQVILIGHSAGGQLLGITPNHTKVAKLISIAGSTGYIKGLKGLTRLLAPLMFNVIFPLARFTLGYAPTHAIGMGENLPKNVAQEWAQFCNKSGYVINAIGQTVQQDFHTKIRCPITAIYATDDEIATQKNVQDLLQLYPNATTHFIALNPKNYGHKYIGHMLIFKKSHQNLWPLIAQNLII